MSDVSNEVDKLKAEAKAKAAAVVLAPIAKAEDAVAGQKVGFYIGLGVALLALVVYLVVKYV